MKKFYTFEPKNFRIFSKMKSFLAVALLLLMAVGNVNAQTEQTKTVSFDSYGFYNSQALPSGDVVSGFISFSTEKNSGTNDPAYYGNSNKDIRLYTGSGDGCALKLSLSGGVIVTAVEIQSKRDQTSTYNFYVDGVDKGKTTNASLSAGQWIKLTGINATETVVFKNTNEAASGSDNQIRITGIKVTYIVTPCTPVVLTDPVNVTLCTLPYQSWQKGKKFFDYNWESGVYQDTIAGVGGDCDTAITVNLTIVPNYYEHAVTIKKGETVYLADSAITTEGDYWHYFDGSETACGCDSGVALTVTVLQPVMMPEVEATICAGKTYSFRGREYTEEDIYFDTVTAAPGIKDTIYTLYLYVNESVKNAFEHSIKPGETWYFTDKYPSIDEAGEYKDTLTAAAASGCDSIVIVTVSVLNPVMVPEEEATICEGKAYNFRGIEYTLADTYYDTVKMDAGINDTIYTLVLTVNPNATYAFDYSMDEGNIYDFFGTTITESGDYSYTLTGAAANGCDSVVTVTVTVIPLPDTVYEETVFVCAGQTYTFHTFEGDSICTETNIYIFTAPHIAQGGRDSIRILNLKVIEEVQIDTNVTVCEGFGQATICGVSFSENMLQFGLNDQVFFLQSQSGCDSAIINLHLTYGRVYNEEVELTLCEDQLKYDWRDTTFYEGSQSGVFVFHKQSVYGCDSTVTLNLTINPVYNYTVDSTICAGALPFTWNDTTINEVGTFTYTYSKQTAAQCDSIVTLNLTVNPIYEETIDTTICSTQAPFVVGDTNYFNETGEYVVRLETANHCDSIINLKLTVNRTYDDTVGVAICLTDLVPGYDWRDTTFEEGTQSGYYTFYKETTLGCDSIVTLNLTVNPIYNETDAVVICTNELPYTYDAGNGNTKVYDENAVSKIDTLHFLTAAGCDSTVVLSLTVNPAYNVDAEETVTICENDLPYTFEAGNGHDTTFMAGTATGTNVYPIHFTTATGCDSIVNFTLTVTPFTACQFTVQVDTGANGTIDGETVVNGGDTARFTVSANDCYYIESIVKNGQPVSVEENATEMVVAFDSVHDNNNTLAATFAMSQYTVTAQAHGEGTITATATFNCDSAVTYSYEAATGYHIDSVKIDDEVTSYDNQDVTEGSYNFGALRANHTIDVYYSINKYQVTVTAGNDGDVNPNGEFTAEYGERPVLTFTADDCMEVSTITVNNVAIDTTCTTFQLDSIKENTNVDIDFETSQYQILVTRAGNGSGKVNDNYDEVAGTYNCNEQVFFTVTADEGSHIDTIIWKDNVMTYDANTVEEGFVEMHLRQDRDIYVVFTLNKMHVVADYDNTKGTVVPEEMGVDYGTSCTFTVNANTADGYHVATITSGDSTWTSEGNEASHEFTLNSVTTDSAIHATFELNNYTVAVETVGNGTVTPAAETVVHGGDLDFHIAAGDCHFIDSVLVDGASYDVTRTDTLDVTVTNIVTADRVLRVVFSEKTYVMASEFSEGNVSDAIVKCDSSYTYTITAPEGKHVDTIYVDGDENFVVGQNDYTFTNIRENHSIRVVFVGNEYDVTASATGNGTVTPTTAHVAHGGEVTFTAVPGDCYHIAKITVNGEPYDLNQLVNGRKEVSRIALDQHFDGVTPPTNATTGNNFGQDCLAGSTSINNANTYGLSGWSFSSVYPSVAKLKGGSSNNPGRITTPALDLTGAYYTIAFDARGWNDETTTILTVAGQTVNVPGSSDCTLNPYSVRGVNGASDVKIQITSANSTEKRYYIDNLVVTVYDSVSTDSIKVFTVSNISENSNVEVFFDIDTFSVHQTIAGNGTVNGFTFADTTVDVTCTSDYTFNIEAAEGNHVVSFTIDGVDSIIDQTNGYVSAVTAKIEDIRDNHEFSVAFAVNTYKLYTQVVTGQGTCNPDELTVDYGSDAMIVVNADVTNGYHIASITTADASVTYTNEDHKVTDTMYFTNVTADDTLKAEFAIDSHLITVINHGNGNVRPATDTTVNFGETVVFDITPDDCYHIGIIMVDSVEQTISDNTHAEYTFANVDAPHTIDVTFDVNTFVVKTKLSYPGQTAITIDSAVACATDYVYEIRAEEGYHIKYVYLDNAMIQNFTEQETAYDVLIENVQETHLIVVNFEINYYDLYLTQEGEGTFTSNPTDLTHIDYNTPVQFTMTADECYELTAFTINDTNYFEQVVNGMMDWNVIDSGNVHAVFSILHYEMAADYDTEMGTVSHADAQDCGSEYKYVIDANEGYHLIRYEIGDSVFNYTNNEITDTLVITNVVSDTTLHVYFEINTYAVTVCSTVENGTFVGTYPIEISYNADTVVKVKADANYHIVSITDNHDNIVALGNNNDTVYTYEIADIASDVEVCATFALNTFTITATAGADGEINPENDSIVNYGDTVVYTITPDPCHYIANVTVDDESIWANPIDSVNAFTYTFEDVDSNHTIAAEFAIFTYTMASEARTEGTITSGVAECDASYDYEITATQGYHIDSVVLDGNVTTYTGQQASDVITVNNIQEDHMLIGYFSIDSYVVTATAGTNGTIVPEGDSAVNYGDAIEYTITPDPCHYISEVLVNDEPVTFTTGDSTNGTYTIASVESAMTVQANFHIYEYAMNAEYDHAMGTVTEGTAECNTEYTYTIQANEDYHIASYTIGGNTVENELEDPNGLATATVTVTGVNQDTNLVVEFAINLYREDVTDSVVASICPGESYIFPLFNGEDTTITTTGIYEFVGVGLSQQPGRDSIRILNLTVVEAIVIDTPITVCDNDMPFTFEGYTYDASIGYGTHNFTLHLENENGCDSVVYNLALTLGHTYDLVETLTICSDQLPYNWRDTTFEEGTVSEAYVFYRESVLGCDSTVTLKLTVNQSYDITIDSAICASALPFTWNDTTLANTAEIGTYTFVYNGETTFGCDSIVTLNLTVNPVYSELIDTILCSSALPFVLGDSSFSETGEYVVRFETAAGCDSTFIVKLTVNQSYDDTTNIAICVNELPDAGYTWRDTTFATVTAAGTYTFTIVKETALGCDSIQTLNLTVNPVYNETDAIVLCTSELPYTYDAGNGNTKVYDANTVSMVDTLHFTTAAGCDSTVILTITVNPAYNVDAEETVTICENDLPYTFDAGNGNDTTFMAGTATGTNVYPIHFTTATGCDSIVNFTLTVTPFNACQFTVHVDAGENGAIEGDTVVNGGDTAVFVVKANDCYYIESITKNGEAYMVAPYSTVDTISFDSVYNNTNTLTATFAQYQYTVTAQAHGEGMVDATATFACDSAVVYNYEAAAGYHIDSVKIDSVVTVYNDETHAEGSHNFGALRENHTIDVYYSINHYILTITGGDHGTVTPNGTDTVTYGARPVLTFTTDDCMSTRTITVNGVAIDTACTSFQLDSIKENTTVSVTFDTAYYKIIVVRGGVGNGMVNNNYNTIAGSYPCNSRVDFDVVADYGSYLDTVIWNGATHVYTHHEMGDIFGVLSITQDMELYVTFKLDMMHVTASTDGNGTITPNDTMVGYGTSCTFTVTADSNNGYHIATITSGENVWTNTANEGTVHEYTLNSVTSDTSAYATFALNNYTVAVETVGEGTATPDSATVMHGSNLGFTIAAGNCHQIDSVFMDGVAQTITATDTMEVTFNNVVTPNSVLRVVFGKIPYAMTSVFNPADGFVSDSIVSCGDDYTYTITPAEGRHIDTIYVDGHENFVTDQDSYTFTGITAPHYIEVVFGVNEYEVTASTDGHGTIAPTTSQVAHGGSQTFSVVPNDCYHIASITVNDSVYDLNQLVNGYKEVSRIALDEHFDNVTPPTNATTGASFDEEGRTCLAGSTSINNANTYGLSGWNFSSVYPSVAKLKGGSRTAGSITTPALDLTGAYYTIAFDAKGWNAGETTTLTVDGQAVAILGSDDCELNPYMVRSNAGTNSTRLTITSNGSSQTRYYIDNLVVTVYDSVETDSIKVFTVSNITENTVVVVNFAMDSFQMAHNVLAGEGTVNNVITADSTVACGSNFTYVIEAAEGNHIVSYNLDGVDSTIDNTNGYIAAASVAVEDIHEDHNLTVNFAVNTYTLYTQVVTGQGSFEPTEVTVNYGADTMIIVKADENNGYHIAAITTADTSMTYTNDDHKIIDTVYFTNVTANDTLKAEFAIDSHLITVINNGHGNVRPTTDTTVTFGETVVFDITPDDCYYISSIMVDSAEQTIDDITASQYTFANVDAPHTIEVTFAPYTNIVRTKLYYPGQPTITIDSAVDCGTDYTYEIRANEGYHIHDVYVDNALDTVFTEEVFAYDVTIDSVRETHRIEVNFEVEHYTLTLSHEGEGTIVSDPTDLTDIVYNTPITFTMTPEACYELTALTINDSNYIDQVVDNVLIWNANTSGDVHAVFSTIRYEMAANYDETMGTVSTDTVNCGEEYKYAITALEGNHIVSYTIGDSTAIFGNNTDVTDTLVIASAVSDTTIDVDFAINTYNVTVCPGIVGGTVVPEVTTLNHGDTCMVSITADSTLGYHIASITCGEDVVALTGNNHTTYTYYINGVVMDTTICVNFELNGFEITVDADEFSSITPANDTTVHYGDTLVCNIKPADDCHFITMIVVDGDTTMINDSTAFTYTFFDVDTTHTIAVRSDVYTYVVNASVNYDSLGTINPTVDTLNCGDDFAYEVLPIAGYHVESVTINGVDRTITDSLDFMDTLRDIHENAVIVANFSVNHYTIVASTDSTGTIAPVDTAVYEYGMGATYTITPSACYYISEVLVDGTAVELTDGDSTNGIYTFDSIAANHTIEAHFGIYQYAMTAEFDSEMGTVTTNDAQDCNSDYTYYITANEGYHIVSFTFNGVTTDNTAEDPNTYVADSVTVSPVSQDTNIVVVFDTNTYTVSACTGAEGGVLVVNDPTVVNHGESTTVTVTADYANGYHIAAITDGRGDTVLRGSNTDTTYTYDVTNVTSNVEVCATFELNTFVITATAGENGTITPDGDTNVIYGDVIDFVIEPANNCYYISDITVDGESVWTNYTDSINAYTLSVNVSEFDQTVDNHTVEAAFTKFVYTMASNAYTEGTVNNGTVDCGEDFTYEIAANEGYHIDHVVLNGVTTNYEGQQDTASIELTDIHENYQLDVYFEINHYTITATVGEHGSIEVEGVTTVAHGDSIEYTITPDNCYYISELLVNGEAAEFTTGDTTGGTYTFTSVEDTMTIHANFHIFEYAMTAEYDETMGTVSESVVNCGTNYTYEITANEGYHIVSMRVGTQTHNNNVGQNEDTEATFNVYNVSSDTICYVEFAPNTYTVNFEVTGEGEVDPGNTTVTYDSTLVYTLTAAEGYHIVSVIDNGTEVYTNSDRTVATYTDSIENIRENHTVEVEFAINQYTITATAGSEGQIVMPGENIVNYGQNIDFTIRATEACYYIDRILVDGEVDTIFSNNETLYTYTFNSVDTDHVIEAQFAIRTYTVAVTSTGNGTIDPDNTQDTLNCGDDVTYTFSPAEGNEILSVTVNGVNMGALTSYSITNIQNDYTIDVVFSQTAFTLTSTAYNHGTIDPLGDTTVAAGSTVVYTLTPEDCYTVSDILVNGTSYLNNEAFDGTTLTLSEIQENMTVQAYFQIKTYKVETEAAVGGAITETAVYNCGTDVVITITPDNCYAIDSVVVDGVNMNDVTEVSFNALDSNHVVNAYFTQLTYIVTSSVNDTQAGTITATDTFNCGETPTYEVTANEGYHIESVVVDGQNMGAIESYTFGSLNDDHTIVANFAINTYTLTVNANAGVTISPVAGDTTVEFGSTVAYTFTVDSCYEIAGVTLDGESIGAVSSYTFDSVNDNHVIVISTNVKTYTITATANEGGTITPAGETTVSCEGTQSYSITAAAGYYVEDVLVDGSSVGAVNNYVFSGVTADHTIEVVFASSDSLTYTITATAGANGTITPEGDTTVLHGASVTYVITPNEYYTIDQVIVDGNVLPTPVHSYTFSNVMADHTIEVTFTADATGCVTPNITYTTNITESSATFNWNDTEAASYTVRYKKVGDTEYTIVTGITDVTYDVTGLEQATEYVWSVKSVCVADEAESAWSVAVTFVTDEPLDTTDIHTVDMSTINVYSFGNDIYVTNESNEQIKDIQVYDINGRLIHRGVAQNNPEVINVTAANGIYIVRVVTDTMVRNYKVSITQR